MPKVFTTRPVEGLTDEDLKETFENKDQEASWWKHQYIEQRRYAKSLKRKLRKDKEFCSIKECPYRKKVVK